MGTALAATVGGFFALGWWMDQWAGTKPVLALVLGSLGVVVALIQFVRLAAKLNQTKP